MYQKSLQQKANTLTNNLFREGKTSYFHTGKKSPNKAIRESNILGHKQHLGHLKLTFEISEIKRLTEVCF